MERHILDSLTLLPILESVYAAHCCSADTSDERLKVVDVESGAGLAMVVAIARPGAPHAVGCLLSRHAVLFKRWIRNEL